LEINKEKIKRRSQPMRKKLDIQRSLEFNELAVDLKVVADYQREYMMIDALLEENDLILDLVHKDLRKFSRGKKKDSTFTTEQVLRMLIVRCREVASYRDVVIRVSENPFLRNFARIGIGPMMDFTFLCKANKFISASTWKKVNEVLLGVGKERKKVCGDRLRVDSTLCETNIHYPTDSHLLWDSYRVLSRLMRNCSEDYPECRMGFRFHDRKIKRLYTYISTHSSKQGKRHAQKMKAMYKTLIDRVGHVYDEGVAYVVHARSLGVKSEYLDEMEEYLPTIRRVVDQSTRRIIHGESVPNREKVFSIFEPHTELIKRGKAGRPVEFGHMVTIGQTGEKFISYYDVMKQREFDNTRTDPVLENHRRQFGSYPAGFAADKNYYKGMDHVRAWEEKIAVFSICKKGNRNAKEKARESSRDFKEMQKFRTGSEGTISVLKRAFGMKRCLLKGYKSFAAGIGCLVFCHNLVLLTT
jgi:IS5 family transposase